MNYMRGKLYIILLCISFLSCLQYGISSSKLTQIDKDISTRIVISSKDWIAGVRSDMYKMPEVFPGYKSSVEERLYSREKSSLFREEFINNYRNVYEFNLQSIVNSPTDGNLELLTSYGSFAFIGDLIFHFGFFIKDYNRELLELNLVFDFSHMMNSIQIELVFIDNRKVMITNFINDDVDVEVWMKEFIEYLLTFNAQVGIELIYSK
jgi:hypothetical protein